MTPNTVGFSEVQMKMADPKQEPSRVEPELDPGPVRTTLGVVDVEVGHTDVHREEPDPESDLSFSSLMLDPVCKPLNHVSHQSCWW